jgi:3-oxoacyl-[acyl-carrier protein] reductase
LKRNPTRELPLAGKSAIVTGVGRRIGIGFAVSSRLIALGASLFAAHFDAHDHRQPWGADEIGPEGVISELRDLRALRGQIVDHIDIDLAQPAAPGELFEAAQAAVGGIDILICNHAQSGEDGALGTLTAAMLDGHYAVNTRSSILLVQEYARRFQRRGAPENGEFSGRVVLLTSGQDLGPMTDEIAYAASKGAIASITSTLATALAPEGISVNCVNPGPVDTGYVEPSVRDEAAALFPTGRWGRPDDPARLIAWLCTPEGGWVTGQVINSERGFRRLR